MKNWKEFIERESKEDYYIKLMEKVDNAYASETVYPPRQEMFSSFELCPYENVKVVIIGQDPYHGAGQAHGLSFSVKPGVKVPPSLKNIYKELKTDLNIDAPKHGYLASWAKQGVLMINTSWTVTEGKAGSHKKFGWAKFTQRVLEVLNDYDKPLVFILWGNHAIEAAKGVTNPKHLLLKAPHPSPLAGGGFFGTKPFSQTNAFLEKAGRGAIDWRIGDADELPEQEAGNKIPTVISANPITKAEVSSKPLAGQKASPKFKTKWENKKEVDTTNDLIIRQHPGTPREIINMNGRQVLLVSNKSKIEFLHSYTFEKLEKPLSLNISSDDGYISQIIKLNNQWNVISKVYHEIKEKGLFKGYNIEVVFHNLETREKTVLETPYRWIGGIVVGDIDGEPCLFVSYETQSGYQVYKYDLQTLKGELHISTDFTKFGETFFVTNENNPVIILSDKSRYNIYDAGTGKQIGETLYLPERLRSFDPRIVQISENRNVLALCNNECTAINIYDLSTGEITEQIVPHLEANEEIKITATYKSKLILKLQSVGDYSKNYLLVCDLHDPERKIHRINDDSGNPVWANGYLKIFEYNNEPTILISGTDTNNKIGNGSFLSLDTYKEMTGLTSVYCREFIPYTDEKGRELFITGYDDAYDNYKDYTTLYNPAGRLRKEEEYNYNYHAVSAHIGKTQAVINISADNHINMYDTETGKLLKCVPVADAKAIKQLLVTEVKGQQSLLTLTAEEIKVYSLPAIEPAEVSFPIEYSINMQVACIEGKKLLMVVNNKFLAWDLQTAQPVSNPLNAAFGINEEDESTYHASGDSYVLRTFSRHGKDHIFIGTVGNDACYWSPDTPDKLYELEIDSTMTNIDPDDPDYFIHSAFGIHADGKDYIVAGAHQRAVVLFDTKTCKRAGRIMKTGENTTEQNYMHKMVFNGVDLLVAQDDYKITVWTLPANKKIKEFKFSGKVTSSAVSGNHIIVFHGEDVTGIEVK